MEENEKGLRPEDVLALEAQWEALMAIDLTALEKEKEARKTSIEKLIEDVKLGNKLVRQFGKKKPIGRPKLHWKTRIKNRAATKSKYYANTWKPKRKAELAQELTTPKGWYEHITRQWKGEVFGYRQWVKYLWPRLEGRVPVFKRDDTKKGWTLDNVVMYESGTRNVLFTPEDYALLRSGDVYA